MDLEADRKLLSVVTIAQNLQLGYAYIYLMNSGDAFSLRTKYDKMIKSENLTNRSDHTHDAV